MFSWISFSYLSKSLFHMTLNFLQSQLSSSFEFRRFRLSWVWSSDKRVDCCWESKDCCESINCCESNDYCESNDCCKSKNYCESNDCCELRNCCEKSFEFCDESSELDWESNDFFEIESSVDSVFAIFCLIRSFKTLVRACIIMLVLSALRFEKVDVVSFFEKNDFSFSTFRTFSSSIEIVSNWNNSSTTRDQFVAFDTRRNDVSWTYITPQ
jgi:hypothetical protein